MTTTLQDVTAKKTAGLSAEEQAARELVRLTREQSLSLTGPDGLLKQLTKTVLETALNEELTEHLGHDKHETPTGGTGNIRNGSRPKTVLTDGSGPVTIDVAPGSGRDVRAADRAETAAAAVRVDEVVLLTLPMRVRGIRAD